jgi:hypothetical protein
MRTTVRLEDALINQAKREAERRGETLTALIEQGLRLVLAHSRTRRQREAVKLPVSEAGGGVLPGVDLNDSASLLDIMELDIIKDARIKDARR